MKKTHTKIKQVAPNSTQKIHSSCNYNPDVSRYGELFCRAFNGNGLHLNNHDAIFNIELKRQNETKFAYLLRLIHTLYDDGKYRYRDIFNKYISWAVPSDKALKFIAHHVRKKTVLEVGCGTGMWAYLLHLCKVKITAIDQVNQYIGDQVLIRYYGQLTDCSGPLPFSDVLFLCWPTSGSEWATNVLTNFKGDMLIYIGEDGDQNRTGCTGTTSFFILLMSEWTEVDSCKEHLRYFSINDELKIYKRNKFLSPKMKFNPRHITNQQHTRNITYQQHMLKYNNQDKCIFDPDLKMDDYLFGKIFCDAFTGKGLQQIFFDCPKYQVNVEARMTYETHQIYLLRLIKALYIKAKFYHNYKNIYQKYIDIFHKYIAWAVPSDNALKFIAHHVRNKTVLEVGCGTGMWAYLLHLYGIKITAIDRLNMNIDNIANDVLIRYYGKLTDCSGTLPRSDVLFLCCPTSEDEWATNVLTNFKGNMLIYIGEVGDAEQVGDEIEISPVLHATPSFFEKLHREWKDVAICSEHLCFSKHFDTLSVYQRKKSLTKKKKISNKKLKRRLIRISKSNIISNHNRIKLNALHS